MTDILVLKNITKSFNQAENNIVILDDVNLTIKKGQIVAFIGSSGSGKTTLLQIAGLLDKADSGEILINNFSSNNQSDKVITNLRKNYIGFIHQSHNLIRELTSVENVMIPQLIQKIDKNIAKEKSNELLNLLGLSARLNHFPDMLSGGEQQRVSIARALVNKPSIILADEPTGNLDPSNAEIVMNYFIKLVRNFDIAAFIVTHNQSLAKQADRIITIKDKKIICY